MSNSILDDQARHLFCRASLSRYSICISAFFSSSSKFAVPHRNGKIEEALIFAQTQMSEAGENNLEVRNELERTLALLAFEKPQNSPFSDLLEQAHRQKVASELNAAILKEDNSENTVPRIINLLKMILWAQNELDQKNVNYPKMTDLSTARIEQKNVEYI